MTPGRGEATPAGRAYDEAGVLANPGPAAAPISIDYRVTISVAISMHGVARARRGNSAVHLRRRASIAEKLA